MSKRMLVISPAWIGDTIMAQSLLRELKQQDSDCVIDVLAPAWVKSVLLRMPEVSEILEMPLGHGQLQLRQRYALGRALRNKNYQQSFVLPNSFKSALIPFWAKIPKRTGWLGEMRWGLLNDVRRLDEQQYPLMVQRYAALAYSKEHRLTDKYLWPKLEVNQPQAAAVKQKYGLSQQQRVLALCPGAEFGPAKQWPAKHYADLAKQYLQKGWSVYLLGSPKDREAAQLIQILTDSACCDLTGKTSLLEAIDILSTVDAVVANDSGLMHMAAALAKPLVAVYGPTTPAFTPPLSEKSCAITNAISCSPCHRRTCPLGHGSCMNELLPTKVGEALESVVS